MCLEKFQHQQFIIIPMTISWYAHLHSALDWLLLVTFTFFYHSSALTQFTLSPSVQLQFESSLSAPQHLRLRFPWLRHTMSWCCIPDNDSIMKKPVKTINYEIKVEDITFHIAAEGSPHILTKYILYESTLLCFVPWDTQLLITSSKDD